MLRNRGDTEVQYSKTNEKILEDFNKDRSEMLIFGPLLTTFEVSNVFLGWLSQWRKSAKA